MITLNNYIVSFGAIEFPFILGLHSFVLLLQEMVQVWVLEALNVTKFLFPQARIKSKSLKSKFACCENFMFVELLCDFWYSTMSAGYCHRQNYGLHSY